VKKSFDINLKLSDGNILLGTVNYLEENKYQFKGIKAPYLEFEFIVKEPGHLLICTFHSPEFKVDLRMLTDIYFNACFNALPDEYPGL
jgi:hypothetical protein